MADDPVLRYASGQPEREGFTCEACGRTVVTAVPGLFANPKPGSPARFCDRACRQAAYRRRRAGIAENAPLQRAGGRGRSLEARLAPDDPTAA
jgi:hypothetical protein